MKLISILVQEASYLFVIILVIFPIALRLCIKDLYKFHPRIFRDIKFRNLSNWIFLFVTRLHVIIY